VYSAGNRRTCPGRGMNLPQRWQKKKPRRPLWSSLLPFRRSPRRRPLRLRCPRPAWLKVSTVLRSKCPRRVVVVTMLTDTLVSLSTGAKAEGSEIPSVVPVEDVAPGTQEAAIEAPEPMEVAAGEAASHHHRICSHHRICNHRGKEGRSGTRGASCCRRGCQASTAPGPPARRQG
jgi:hypothetical protein